MTHAVTAVLDAVRRRPSARTVRGAALAAIIADTLIVVTGGAVRLTGSGLGCPRWPECTTTSLLPQASADHSVFHADIEFGNRMVTFVVVAAAIVAAVIALRQRPRRRSVVTPALWAVGVVALQAVVGGISIIYDLDWGWVAVHFLLSMVLLWLAVLLHRRAGEGDATPTPLVRPELRVVAWALAGVTAATLVAGTLVTATGPHAGDPSTKRLALDAKDVTQFHADLVFLLVGLTVALWLALKAVDAPARLRQAVTLLFAVEMAQGIIGYVQYFTHVPPVLVGFHMFGACLVWITALRVALSTRERGGVPPFTTAQPPYAASVGGAPVSSAAARAGLPPNSISAPR